MKGKMAKILQKNLLNSKKSSTFVAEFVKKNILQIYEFVKYYQKQNAEYVKYIII